MSRNEALAVAAVTAVVWQWTGDVLGAASIGVLWAIWKLLPVQGYPPVLALAMTFQWLQVTAGLYFTAITGRVMVTMVQSDYRPMVAVGLGCVLALTVGLWLGVRVLLSSDHAQKATIDVPWVVLLSALASVTFLQGGIQRLAWDLPGFTQAILTLGLVRLGVLYLVFQRLMVPDVRWGPFLALLAAEVALGMLGFFAGFREPLLLALAVLLQAFDRHKVEHWVGVGMILVVGLSAGVLWMGVRGQFRQEFRAEDILDAPEQLRFERMSELVNDWVRVGRSGDLVDDVERVVDRLWVVYYPALAMRRVPSIIPHTDGELLQAAILHAVTPRLLFPEKPPMRSDSERVRHFSGVWVAGQDEGTTIAFGYAIESYVDFGIPTMFVVVFVYGLLMGCAFAFFANTLRHREIAVPFLVVAFWLSLYLFERSWAHNLGFGGLLLLYLGAAALIADRFVSRREASRQQEVTYLYP